MDSARSSTLSAGFSSLVCVELPFPWHGRNFFYSDYATVCLGKVLSSVARRDHEGRCLFPDTVTFLS